MTAERDFTGPDELVIPESVFGFLHTKVPRGFVFDAETFRWRDKGGAKYQLRDIDDSHLTNIVNFLERRLPKMDVVPAVYWSAVQSFLTEEIERREAEVLCG